MSSHVGSPFSLSLFPSLPLTSPPPLSFFLILPFPPIIPVLFRVVSSFASYSWSFEVKPDYCICFGLVRKEPERKQTCFCHFKATLGERADSVGEVLSTAGACLTSSHSPEEKVNFFF